MRGDNENYLTPGFVTIRPRVRFKGEVALRYFPQPKGGERVIVYAPGGFQSKTFNSRSAALEAIKTDECDFN